MNGVVRENEGGHIVKLALVLLAPCLSAPQTGLLGAGQDHAHFRVLQGNTGVLQRLHHGNAHIAAGQIIVGAVYNAVLVPHPVQSH